MDPKLYIIMRRDLYDNSPGKMMAQAAHAQADFDAFLASMARTDNDEFWQAVSEWRDDREFARTDNDEFWQAVSEWRDDREFGVTLVLSATYEEMLTIVDVNDHAGMTIDPTYPWRNWYGELFTSEEITCMWTFVYREEEIEYMQQYNLHK